MAAVADRGIRDGAGRRRARVEDAALEWLFTGGRGWWAWAAILLAAAVVGRGRRADGDGSGLAARLGRARGRLPSAVFLGLAAVFAIDAAALRDPALWMAAAGPIAALLWISGRASSGS
jgi:hypothetical protein